MSYGTMTEEITKAHLKYPKPYDWFLYGKALESWLKLCSYPVIILATTAISAG